MNQPIPPPIPKPSGQKRRTVRVLILVLLVCFLGFVLFPLVVAIILGVSTFSWVKDTTTIHFKSYTDTFQVTVLELKSEPDYFTERVRIRCERDMEASIWVADLQEAGIFKTNGPAGEIIYREGHPAKIKDSISVRADGDFSTCDILFTVSTTSSNTAWHSRISTGTTNVFGSNNNSGGVDTTLPTPLTVSGIQTNWPSSYGRGSDIPLANLGDYKILLLVK